MHLIVNGRKVKASSLMRYPVKRVSEKADRWLQVVGFTVHNRELATLVIYDAENNDRFTVTPQEVVFQH